MCTYLRTNNLIDVNKMMPFIQNMKHHSILIGRLDNGVDLLDGLVNVCLNENITLGRIEGVGAVKKARIGFYNQKTLSYSYRQFDHPLEITKLVGNISLKDQTPFIHAHITLADKNGNAYGGHLASGTVVFMCEFILEVYDGVALERFYNDETGLLLWKMKD